MLREADPGLFKAAKRVIDLTGDDNDGEGGDGDFIETASGSPANSVPLTPPSLIKSPAHTPDDLATSSAAAIPGKKKNLWVNVPEWSPLHRRLQQYSDRPLNNLIFDAMYAGTDSSRSPSTELELAPKNSSAPATERLESSLEIPETPAAALKMMRHEEDDHGDDGEEHHGRSTQTLVAASVVAGDAASEVDGTSSVIGEDDPVMVNLHDNENPRQTTEPTWGRV